WTVISVLVLYILVSYVVLWMSVGNIQSKSLRLSFILILLSLPIFPLALELAGRNGYFVFEITIEGTIQPSMFVAVKGFVDKSLVKPRKLIVTSPGGNIPTAMAIGKLIHHLEMDVEVRGYCASACANYMFPSGRNKVLSENSLIVYHGGM